MERNYFTGCSKGLCEVMSKLSFESEEGHRQAETSVMTFQAESTINVEALGGHQLVIDDHTKGWGSLGEGAEEGVRDEWLLQGLNSQRKEFGMFAKYHGKQLCGLQGGMLVLVRQRIA